MAEYDVVPAAPSPVHLALRCAYAGLSLDVQCANPDDAERIIERFWNRLEQRERAGRTPFREDRVAPQRSAKLGEIEVFKRRMDELNLTQTELATRAKIGVGHLSMIFRGKAGLTEKRRAKLIEVLGLPSNFVSTS